MEKETKIEKEKFYSEATLFFEAIFNTALKNHMGMIEIRAFKNGDVEQDFFDSIDEADFYAWKLIQAGYDVYFGVNPRMHRSGDKGSIEYVAAFHVDLDYGKEGYKKSLFIKPMKML
ncbi:MAG: hypothetical protein ABSE95_19180 [Thermodesulfobacteriota bacterium]|jgi:hypothetical protein